MTRRVVTTVPIAPDHGGIAGTLGALVASAVSGIVRHSVRADAARN